MASPILHTRSGQTLDSTEIKNIFHLLEWARPSPIDFKDNSHLVWWSVVETHPEIPALNSELQSEIDYVYNIPDLDLKV